jgi:hypothetical protein
MYLEGRGELRCEKQNVVQWWTEPYNTVMQNDKVCQITFDPGLTSPPSTGKPLLIFPGDRGHRSIEREVNQLSPTTHPVGYMQFARVQ